MSQSDHILTPLTEKYFFGKKLLTPLLRGESITVVWVPHGGIRTKMRFFIKNADFFGLNKIGKYKIAYINPYEMIENTPVEYFRLMINSLGETVEVENKNPLLGLEEKIVNLLNLHNHIIFILGEFSKINFSSQFYNNLFALYQLNRTKIHYIFNLSQDILLQKIDKYDQLLPLLEQNKIYFPLSREADSQFMLNKFIEQYPCGAAESSMAREMAGGHPSLLNACLRFFSVNSSREREKVMENLSEQTEIRIILEDIWRVLGKEEKNFLTQLINGSLSPESEIPVYLKETRVVQIDNGQLMLFSPLFARFIEKKQKRKQLSLDPKSDQILVNGLPTQQVSFSEYQLLKTFLKNPNKIISRDMLAEILWQEDSYEKYSDWAIDRLACRLRKKLQEWNIPPSSIQTIRGRGYRWLEN